jgi:hypothetical protein
MQSTTFKLGINFISHIVCPVASKHAINSAYIMDDATIDYLELLHEKAPPARVNTYPNVDFLSSLSPAKSASEYPLISEE